MYGSKRWLVPRPGGACRWALSVFRDDGGGGVSRHTVVGALGLGGGGGGIVGGRDGRGEGPVVEGDEGEEDKGFQVDHVGWNLC